MISTLKVTIRETHRTRSMLATITPKKGRRFHPDPHAPLIVGRGKIVGPRAWALKRFRQLDFSLSRIGLGLTTTSKRVANGTTTFRFAVLNKPKGKGIVG